MKLPRLSAPTGLLLAFLGAAVPAYAAQYWTWPDLLKDFFKTAQKVKQFNVTLPEADATEISKKLGVPVKRDWKICVADPDGPRAGYAIQDAEIGLHEDIDYAVRFDPKGTVDRVEIMVYREAYGDQVRSERFRQQFVGKTAKDPITAGQDIDVISGASYSSKSVALGVKRDTLVLQAAMKNGL